MLEIGKYLIQVWKEGSHFVDILRLWPLTSITICKLCKV